MDLKIVNASWKHYALLAEIGGTTFYETFSNDNEKDDMDKYVSKTYNLEQMAKNLSNKEIQYFVVYDAEKDLGYTKLIHNVTVNGLDGKIIELEKIYVRAEVLGAKVGKKLMESAIEFSRNSGYEHLFLGVWQENVRAITFYEKFGFKTFTTRKFSLGKRVCDDFLMAVKL